MARTSLNGTVLPQMEKSSELWHLVQSLQREAGGGTAKAVNITLFFDANGRLKGKSKCKVTPFYPSTIWDDLVNC